MPAFNAGRFIEQSLNSVIEQSFTDWELIVVDDESTDNTAEIVKNYALRDKRIHYVWQKNGKQGKARNFGIAKSSGKWIAFLDADDVWMPDKLERQLILFRESNVHLVFGHSFVTKNNVKTAQQIGRGSGFYQHSSAEDFLLYADALIMSTVMVRKDALIAVDGFGEDLRFQYCEDWHLWLKLAFSGFIFFSDGNVVSYYRIHESSATHIESEASTKFFYALLDLHFRFQTSDKLLKEVYKRARALVFHKKKIDRLLAADILIVAKIAHPTIVAQLIPFRMLLTLSIHVFRRIFLVVYPIK